MLYRPLHERSVWIECADNPLCFSGMVEHGPSPRSAREE
jgi:hypothetical protein